MDVNPNSYGADDDKMWDEVKEYMSAAFADAIDNKSSIYQSPFASGGVVGAIDGYPIVGAVTETEASKDWKDIQITAANIAAIIPVSQEYVDRYQLDKEDYDAKYPPIPEPKISWWNKKFGSLRFSWGVKVGSWIAGEDLSEMIYSLDHDECW